MSVVNLVAERPPEPSGTLPWKSWLRRHPLFTGLTDVELEWLLGAPSSRERTLAPGEVVFEQGERSDSFYLIGRGSVRVCLASDSHASVELATLKAGDYFGEMALFDRSPHAATVLALQGCVLRELPGEALRDLMNTHPELEMALLLTLTERLRRANERILAQKVRDGDEPLKLLDARLSAEVRVFDASLKAAHVVFEQTKVRTDEVINSAERARTRLTSVASATVTVLTLAGMLLGGLGIREVWSLRELRGEVLKFKQESGSVAEDLATIRRTTEEAKDILARDQVLPALRKALAQGVPYDAKSSFERLAELGWVTDDRITQLLAEVEVALVAPRDPAGAVARTDVPAFRERRDFTPLLGEILERAKTPEAQAKAYSLLLANAILADTAVIEGPSGGEPKAVRARFREFMARHRGQGLLGNEDWAGLEERLRQEGPEKLEAFRQVMAAIPRS